MLRLNGCSFIGVDHDTKFEDLLDLGAKDRSFEFLEFGILYSNSKMGTHKRYPSKEYINEFIEEYEKLTSKPFYTSIHLCGDSIKELLDGDEPLTRLCEKFDRIQLNFKATDFNPDFFFSNLNLVRLRMVGLRGHTAPFFVIQANKSKQNYITHMELSSAPLHQYCHVLFDGSGGFGRVLEDPLPPIAGYYCGYAGGLGPDTIGTVIPKIEKAFENATYKNRNGDSYYVDMESQIRTDNVFDLKKCETVMDMIQLLDMNP